MKYYKIIHGFNSEEYIKIDETELQKALGAFLLKRDAVFSGGAIKAGMIQDIKPDYHRMMGWNRGYKLQPEDYEELEQKGIEKKTMYFFSATKEVVQSLISSGQLEQIGFAPIPEMKELPRGGGMRSIAEIAG